MSLAAARVRPPVVTSMRSGDGASAGAAPARSRPFAVSNTRFWRFVLGSVFHSIRPSSNICEASGASTDR